MSSQEKKKYFTFMLIPHSEGAVRCFRIPRFIIQTLGCLFIGALVCACYFYYDYSRVKSHLPELHQLRETNDKQKGEIESLANQAANLEEKLTELDELEPQAQEPSKPLLSKLRRGGPVAPRGLRGTAQEY